MTQVNEPSPLVGSVARAVDAHRDAEGRPRPGVLLEVLHTLQHELGHLPTEVVAPVAEALNLSRAEVHGVISFYPDFRPEGAGAAVVQICRAEACQAVGAAAVLDDVQARLGVRVGQTSADGVTLQEVFCFGNCALGPAATVNGRLYGRVDADRLVELAREGSR